VDENEVSGWFIMFDVIESSYLQCTDMVAC